ncbi:MAG: 5'/3'-nucleotidase SurE [Rhodospirillales bacterium]
MDLSGKRVLVSNDDGYQAPGIAVLAEAMAALGAEVWISAPRDEQSAAGHSLTIRRPLRIIKQSDRVFAVDGTPTDAVLLGVLEVMKETPPDLMVSGINRGGNLGEDVTYSGTVAAAMEGTLLGIPSIAFSLVVADGAQPKWATARLAVERTFAHFAGLKLPPKVLLNVNIPDVAEDGLGGVELTRQGYRKIGSDIHRAFDPRGEAYYWIGAQREEDRYAEGTDLEAVGRGVLSVTPLGLDLTHEPTRDDLARLGRA